MLAVVFAALSGLAYGASDFAGGVATKEDDSRLITLAMQVVSLACLVVVLLVIPHGTLVRSDLVWGGIGGIGAAAALTMFYRALARGPMAVAASITAVVGSLVPVIVGLTLGEIPAPVTLAGAALAIPATLLVSVGGSQFRADIVPGSTLRRFSAPRRTVTLGVAAGFGFALFFVALAQTSEDGGLYPLVGARLASITFLALILTGGRAWSRPGRSQWLPIGLAGALDCGANAAYLTALDSGSLTWVAAITSLYPVSTVLLARVLLDEALSRTQAVGFALAAAALVLVSLGA